MKGFEQEARDRDNGERHPQSNLQSPDWQILSCTLGDAR
jgi:hypothetical protein